ncbi:patatin-like phospholipase family protein [Novipirellula artificiosorum]|uniref:NTE family protein RssA n=1 Tax=Novipirellula artificiosorum TaxID=2528016 RepID=A0A5C6E5U6_9BACT|nr:patatin-like phospholipase family protein [Novipirellula artificiosorum]TWU42499.1 NTE family protein RssA [Novipirellula artificiosorum]
MRKLIDFLGFRSGDAVRQPPMRRAVIALGGGGARGLSHLGAIQAVGEAGIQTERFVGVSIGAMVGAMCAIDPNLRRVETRTIEFLSSPTFARDQRLLFGSTTPHLGDCDSTMMAWYNRVKHLYSAHRRLTRAVTKMSLMPGAILADAIDALIDDTSFADLVTPLSVVAADLRSGHRVVLESGSVRKAVKASMAIPGIFPPVEWDGMLLCDIGVVDSLPSTVAKSYASDMTIAVDVGQAQSHVEDCSTALDVVMRMQDLGERMMRREKSEVADLLIRPHLDGVQWFDFQNPQALIDRGRDAGRKSLAGFLARKAG